MLAWWMLVPTPLAGDGRPGAGVHGCARCAVAHATGRHRRSPGLDHRPDGSLSGSRSREVSTPATMSTVGGAGRVGLLKATFTELTAGLPSMGCLSARPRVRVPTADAQAAIRAATWGTILFGLPAARRRCRLQIPRTLSSSKI